MGSGRSRHAACPCSARRKAPETPELAPHPAWSLTTRSTAVAVARKEAHGTAIAGRRYVNPAFLSHRAVRAQLPRPRCSREAFLQRRPGRSHLVRVHRRSRYSVCEWRTDYRPGPMSDQQVSGVSRGARGQSRGPRRVSAPNRRSDALGGEWEPHGRTRCNLHVRAGPTLASTSRETKCRKPDACASTGRMLVPKRPSKTVGFTSDVVAETCTPAAR